MSNFTELTKRMSTVIVSPEDSSDAGTPDLSGAPRSRNWDRGYWTVIAAAVVIAVCIFALPEISNLAVGVLVIALSVLLLIAGIHVGLAIMAAGAIGMWKLAGTNAMAVTLEDVPFTSAASWSLSVIPLFILMGVAMGRFELTAKLFSAARQWMGKLPGGLAISTNLAGAGLAASSGSSIAISYALGRTTIPEMIRAGYKPSLAAGVVTMAGSLGMLIPPSVVLVIYSGVAETPVGPQLLAALVPGLITAVAYSLMILLRAAINPSLAPRDPSSYSWPDRFRSLANVTPVALIMFLLIGGLYSGIVTPTEAGAVGALAAILLGWLFGPNRSLKFLGKTLVATLRETATGVAAIFLLLMGVHVLTRVVVLSGVADALTAYITSLGLSRVEFLLVLVVGFIVLGMFMDGLAMILMTVPILMPVLVEFDVDLIWFGVFMVMVVELAMVTPPIGVLSYVVHRITQNPAVNLGTEIKLSDVFKGTSWFVIINILLLVVLIFIPDIALWLPENSSAK